MFEEFLGIPAHPLLVHAAVVFVPLQVLAAVTYAFVPRFRRNIAWFVAATLVIAPGAAFLAKLSGDAFRARIAGKGFADAELLSMIDKHRSYGTITLYLSLALSILMLLLLLFSRSGATGMFVPPGIGGVVLAVLTLGVGIAAGIYVVLTGDTGAHTAWKGQ